MMYDYVLEKTHPTLMSPSICLKTRDVTLCTALAGLVEKLGQH